jgi:pyruvate dehydrogenase E2 component (dihydrolipoamide acetyltransferase)
MREFKLPDVGEGVAEGELLVWHVEPGDRVAEDQVVAEVETDKAVVDVPSPVNGTVRELRAEPGDVVPVGDVIITFDVDGEESADGAAEAAAGESSAEPAEETADESENGQSGGRVFAPPSARRLARELGVDIGGVDGSGPGGRITEADVRAAAESAGEGDDAVDTDVDADEGEEAGGLKPAVTRIDDGEDGADAGEDGAGDEDDGLTSVVTAIDDGSADGAAGTATSETAETAPSEPADRERTLATPATRRVAQELDVDLDSVPTDETRDGEPFVTEAAVREYAEAQQRAQAADAAAVAGGESGAGGGPTTSAETAIEPADTLPVATGEDEGEERREPYRGVRKTIGEAMERSKFTAPHVTHHDTVDVTELVETRERLKPRAEERGVKLTYLPFVLKAVVAALQEHPVLNTSLDEENEEIVYRNYYDIGVATATDAGLMVPVVESVDEKGLLEIAEAVTDLTARARDRSIDLDELRGSTFSVTNFGATGGEYATPIINYPETAILGMGEIKERPMVVDGEVVARHVLTLSLSVDHRVVDGADAARFVNTLKEYLEDPSLLLLE